VGLLVIACGGSDDADASEYFEAVEEAKARLDESLPPDLHGQLVEEVVRRLRAENGLVSGFADDVAALEPPSTAADDHATVVRLSRARVQVQDQIANGLLERGGEAFREYVPLRENTRLEWAEAVCRLGQHAADAGVTVELGCGAEDFAVLQAFRRDSVRLNTGEAPCVAATRARDAELERGQATLIYFINDSDETVGLHLTGDDGEMELVRSLAPDDAHVQITTVGTGWIVTDTDGECLGGGLPRGPGGVNIFINPVAPRSN
jgi:hypothetical protein